MVNILKNIDNKIANYFTKMIDENKVSHINYICFELNLFLTNITEYFDTTESIDLKDIKILELKIKETNLYQNILSVSNFSNFLKILYRIGLSNFEELNSDIKFIFLFNIENKNIKKMNSIKSILQLI